MSIDSSIGQDPVLDGRYSFAVIVPTIGRVSELGALLESLRRQSKPPQEVIIVDQNPDERLGVLLQQFQDLPIDWVRVQTRGAARARNLGKRRAKAEVLTFPDDDCEYPDDLLQRVEGLFRDNPDYDGISLASRDRYQPGGITRFAQEAKEITRFNVFRCSVEAGVFFRHAAVVDTGYDESMGVGAPTPYWSDEGPDLLLRLMSEGKRFLYVPDPVVFHPDPVRNYDEKAVERSSRYGCGRGYFLRKHNYPLWFTFYMIAGYAAGAALALVRGHQDKARYYWRGFRSRLDCYLGRR